MANLTVDAVVHNQVARVALDQTFTNPRERELEGVYRFAIPADAALQRLAMYVDGTLTESAVVERMQARRIYEDLVYRRIDPGLLPVAERRLPFWIQLHPQAGWHPVLQLSLIHI